MISMIVVLIMLILLTIYKYACIKIQSQLKSFLNWASAKVEKRIAK